MQRINNVCDKEVQSIGKCRTPIGWITVTLVNDCTRKLGMAPPKRAVVTTDEYEGSIPSLVTKQINYEIPTKKPTM